MSNLTVLDVTRASTTAVGTQGYGDTELTMAPFISADGTKVAFHSVAPNLVPGDTNNGYDIFVKDLETGEIVRANTALDGSQAEGDFGGLYPVLSADGSKVAFRSAASNLVPGDTNGLDDVFVKNLESGQIIRVEQSENSGSHHMSADGSRVAVQANGGIYVQDLASGAVIRADVDAAGVPVLGNTYSPFLTADGSRVAFATAGFVDESGAGVFLKDLSTGAIVKIASGALNFRLSEDGTKVAYTSSAADLVPGDTNDQPDVFVTDLKTWQTTRVNTTNLGAQSSGEAFVTDLSADGTRVVFASAAADLVPDDTNGTTDVFVKDLASGAIVRVSVGAGGVQANGPSEAGSVSADGGTVSFESLASNLVPGDTNGAFDVFVARLNQPVGRTLVGSGRDDMLGGGTGDDVLEGAGGNDLLLGRGGNDRLRGGGGRDTLDGGTGSDTLDGDRGADTLIGGAGPDTVNGNDGNDTILWRNGDGSDLVNGGNGSDRQMVNGTAVRDAFSVGAGIGNTAVVTLTGDTSSKLTLSDVETLEVDGLGGDDQFAVNFFSGTDLPSVLPSVRFDGGTGSDVQLLNVAGLGNAFTVGASGGTAIVDRTSGTPFQLTLNDVETLEVHTSSPGLPSGENRLTLNTLAGTDVSRVVFRGDALGRDVLDGSGTDVPISAIGGDERPNREGLNDHDTLMGGSADDVLEGRGGDDSLNGGGGADTLIGGIGRDTLDGADGDDTFVWLSTRDYQDGIDTVHGGRGNDTQRVGGSTLAGVFTLGASGGAAVLSFQDGSATPNDFLTLEGVETLEFDAEVSFAGRRSELTITGLVGTGLKAVVFNGPSGNDAVNGAGTGVRITASGGLGDDTLTGGSAKDVLNGDGGNDRLFGGKGADTLNGGMGDDHLFGNQGADILTGGGGADIFGFVGSTAADVITDFDFSAGDRIGIAAGTTYTVGQNTVGEAVIAFSSSDRVTLTGIAGDQITPAFFVIV